MLSQNSLSMWNNSKNKSVEDNAFNQSNQYGVNADAYAWGGQGYWGNRQGSSSAVLSGWQGNNTVDIGAGDFDESMDVTPYVSTVSPKQSYYESYTNQFTPSVTDNYITENAGEGVVEEEKPLEIKVDPINATEREEKTTAIGSFMDVTGSSVGTAVAERSESLAAGEGAGVITDKSVGVSSSRDGLVRISPVKPAVTSTVQDDHKNKSEVGVSVEEKTQERQAGGQSLYPTSQDGKHDTPLHVETNNNKDSIKKDIFDTKYKGLWTENEKKRIYENALEEVHKNNKEIFDKIEHSLEEKYPDFDERKKEYDRKEGELVRKELLSRIEFEAKKKTLENALNNEHNNALEGMTDIAAFTKDFSPEGFIKKHYSEYLIQGEEYQDLVKAVNDRYNELFNNETVEAYENTKRKNKQEEVIKKEQEGKNTDRELKLTPEQQREPKVREASELLIGKMTESVDLIAQNKKTLSEVWDEFVVDDFISKNINIKDFTSEELEKIRENINDGFKEIFKPENPSFGNIQKDNLKQNIIAYRENLVKGKFPEVTQDIYEVIAQYKAKHGLTEIPANSELNDTVALMLFNNYFDRIPGSEFFTDEERKGQEEWYGGRFNITGIINRAIEPEIKEYINRQFQEVSGSYDYGEDKPYYEMSNEELISNRGRDYSYSLDDVRLDITEKDFAKKFFKENEIPEGERDKYEGYISRKYEAKKYDVIYHEVKKDCLAEYWRQDKLNRDINSYYIEHKNVDRRHGGYITNGLRIFWDSAKSKIYKDITEKDVYLQGIIFSAVAAADREYSEKLIEEGNIIGFLAKTNIVLKSKVLEVMTMGKINHENKYIKLKQGGYSNEQIEGRMSDDCIQWYADIVTNQFIGAGLKGFNESMQYIIEEGLDLVKSDNFDAENRNTYRPVNNRR